MFGRKLMPCAWRRELQDQKTPFPKMFVETDDFCELMQLVRVIPDDKLMKLVYLCFCENACV